MLGAAVFAALMLIVWREVMDDILLRYLILFPYVIVCGAAFAAPAIHTVKHAGKLFLLNVLVFTPLFVVIAFNIPFDPNSLITSPDNPSIVASVVSTIVVWALFPMYPALMSFLPLLLFAKRYAASFGRLRLFGTLVCSSALSLTIMVYITQIVLRYFDH